MQNQPHPQVDAAYAAPLKTWTPADGVKVIPLALETRSHVDTEEANGNPSAQASRKHTSTETQADLLGTVHEPLSTLPNPGTQARRVLELLATGEQPDHAKRYELAGSWHGGPPGAGRCHRKGLAQH